MSTLIQMLCRIPFNPTSPPWEFRSFPSGQVRSTPTFCSVIRYNFRKFQKFPIWTRLLNSRILLCNEVQIQKHSEMFYLVLFTKVAHYSLQSGKTSETFQKFSIWTKLLNSHILLCNQVQFQKPFRNFSFERLS
jgi:hypothetical protein